MTIALLSTFFVSLTGFVIACSIGAAMFWGARQSPAVRKYLVDLARALRGGR
jgi:hypothetical protein